MYPFTVLVSSFILPQVIVSRQSVFQPHHSTDSILIKMTACLRQWTKAYTCTLNRCDFVDLLAAFDEANYDLFIAKLQMHGGCFSKPLGSKAMHLSDRRHRVT